MMIKDALAAILREINPLEMPLQYILAAEIVTQEGEKKLLHGPEIEALLALSTKANFPGARIMLDVQKIHWDVIRASGEWLIAHDAVMESHDRPNRVILP